LCRRSLRTCSMHSGGPMTVSTTSSWTTYMKQCSTPARVITPSQPWGYLRARAGRIGSTEPRAITPNKRTEILFGGSVLGRRLRRRVFASPSSPRPPGETVEIEEDHRRGVEREQLAHREAADDGVAERLADFRAGARAEHERHSAQHRRHRGHED